eukprot:gene17224-23737_t
MINGCGLSLDGKSVSEMLHHSEWAYEKVRAFYGREMLIDSCLDKITSNKNNNKYGICLAVIGVSGSGKTALMAKLAESIIMRTLTSPDAVVIIRFCGTSPGSNNAFSLVRSICQQLELVLSLPVRSTDIPKYSDLVKYFHELLNQHPVIMLIDSLDQLTDEDMGRSQLTFLDGVKLHEHSRIIVSSLPDDKRNEKGIRKYLYLCETRLREANVPRVDIIQ